MFRFVDVKWMKFFIFSMLTVTDIYASSLISNELISFLDLRKTRVAGFDLNEEDIAKFHIWSSGIVPYYIDDVSFDKVLRDRIRVFLGGVNRLTPLRFVEMPKPPDDDSTRWVIFLNRKGLLGCADHPFKSFTNEGVQRVVLGYDCMNSDGNLADIVLSLVGVPPQHNAPDRDQSVTIMMDNIVPDKLHLFEKLEDDEWLFHKLKYDEYSAGHYGPYKHTSNGYATVLRKTVHYNSCNIRAPSFTPKEIGFSVGDILKIAILYNYILKNKETTAPECSKLFEIGGTLSSSRPQYGNIKGEPREKPARYLGIPKKEQMSDSGENLQEIKYKEVIDDNERSDKELLNDEYDLNVSGSNYDNGNNAKYKKNEKSAEKLNENDEVNNDNGDDSIKESDNEFYTYSKNVVDNEVECQNNNKLNNDEGSKNEDMYKKDQTKNKKTIKKLDKEDIKSYKNNEVVKYVTSCNCINTTRNSDRMRLSKKIINIKKLKLLGQSDYETGDEGKNKYIHEKNF